MSASTLGISLSEELNDQQRAAAVSGSQHTLVLAGAGTGKTSTIIARVEYLLKNGVDAAEIAVLTFTRAAAHEVEERVRLRVGAVAENLVVTTFHGWAMSLLRGHPEAFDYEDWTVIDRDDQLALVRHLRGRRKRGTFPKPSEIVDVLSYARNVNLDIFSALSIKLPDYSELHGDVVDLLDRYLDWKAERRYLDFDDILLVLAKSLEASTELSAWLGNLYPHLLIDETQDTNPLQWMILDALVPHTRLFAVGDDAQSIYGFRGADFKSIHSFADRVPGSVVRKLTVNYRSTQEILDISNWLLEQSPLNYDKKLTADRGQGKAPEFRYFDSDWDEARWVCDDIQRIHADGKDWRSNLILTRTKHGGRVTEAALIERRIPYRFLGGQALLQSAHIRDLIALLRASVNPLDELAWMRLLQLYPKVGEVRAAHTMEALLIALEQSSSNVSSEDQSGRSVRDARDRVLSSNHPDLIPAFNELDGLQSDAAAAIRFALQHLEPLLEAKWAADRWDIRKRDFETLEILAKSISSVRDFINDYVLNPMYVTELFGASSSVDDAVTLATVHSSKGLEAEHSYVLGVAPGNYPWVRAESLDEVEEERRVLYVALTRAKDRLVMCGRVVSHVASDKRLGASADYFFENLPPDMFLAEADRSPARRGKTFRGKRPGKVDLRLTKD